MLPEASKEVVNCWCRRTGEFERKHIPYRSRGHFLLLTASRLLSPNFWFLNNPRREGVVEFVLDRLGVLGGGGLGDLAIRYGYQRFDWFVVGVIVVLLIVLVQGAQLLGNAVARRVMHA